MGIFTKQHRLTEGLTLLKSIYQENKTKFGDIIILFPIRDHFIAFFADAKVVSHLCNLPVDTICINDTVIQMTKFYGNKFNNYLTDMVSKGGRKVMVINDTFNK